MNDSSDQTPWQGDWKDRLYTKLRELQYDGLDTFLFHKQGLSYLKLADVLKGANVAAMQIYGEQLSNCLANGNLREVALDSLVRFINQHLKRGWGVGRHFDYRIASAFGDWKSVLRQFSGMPVDVDAILDAVTRTLKAQSIPLGWNPLNNHDGFIRRAFDLNWPLDTSPRPSL